MRLTGLARRRSDPRAGFSLIEVLAALAIAGAVFTVLVEFTGRTLRQWQHGRSTIAVMEMVTRGLGQLARDFSAAVPMSPPGSDGATVYFTGNGDHLRFVAATGFGNGDHGIELLDIGERRDSDGNMALVRRRGPIVGTSPKFGDPVALLRGRIRVRFAYRDSTGHLYSDWTARPNLPAAVVVRILTQDGNAGIRQRIRSAHSGRSERRLSRCCGTRWQPSGRRGRSWQGQGLGNAAALQPCDGRFTRQRSGAPRRQRSWLGRIA